MLHIARGSRASTELPRSVPAPGAQLIVALRRLVEIDIAARRYVTSGPAISANSPPR
jgi:hypothetical protein